MNTFLTDFEHGLEPHPQPQHRRVNFSRETKGSFGGGEFRSPYVEYYLQNMDRMECTLEKKLNWVLLRWSTDLTTASTAASGTR